MVIAYFMGRWCRIRLVNLCIAKDGNFNNFRKKLLKKILYHIINDTNSTM